MTRIPRVQCWTPPGLGDPRIAVGASRAGALGVLDVSMHTDRAFAAELIGRTSRLLGTRKFGIRGTIRQVREGWWDDRPQNLSTIIFNADECAIASYEGLQDLDVLAEVRSRREAEALTRSGFTNLVLFGNEGGGSVSEESSFVLLQAVLKVVPEGMRVWVRGAIGLAAAAGVVAAGAVGVVLDGALLLTKESPIPKRFRDRIQRWDGTETAFHGQGDGTGIRVFEAPGSNSRRRIDGPAIEHPQASRFHLSFSGWAETDLWPIGQDGALASDLARRYKTVGGVVQAVEASIETSISAANTLPSLSEGSAFARSVGTRYPILQGPMTRVSDHPAFAKAVSNGGGLPFLALALSRGAPLDNLLREASENLTGRSWGVGVLGFADPALRREQAEAILAARPPFALIAGGRPDQARPFEEAGIVCFLHAPSPGLLRQFLREGARRFVLEGRECGGHVGPRSSLLLWEQAGRTVLDSIEAGVNPSEIHLAYAGGIHDATSAAVVAALSAPLAVLGVKIGVLIGTAYLFTKEIVDSEAIVVGFQDQALRCETTVLLETGPGHLVRVSPSPFTKTFEGVRSRLVSEGTSAEVTRETLERMNVGRLRVAAKGIDRSDGAASEFEQVNEHAQYERGLYMLGQVATLRDRPTTIDALHRELMSGATERLARLVPPNKSARKRRSRPSDIAIIGMAAIVPGAADVRRSWENTLRGRDAITEIPKDRWDWRLYYDADKKTPDKITSRWGGFLPEIPFDPLDYGMPPTSLTSIEPLHLLTLDTVRAALEDAGYRDRSFPRERTAVVLGAGGGAAQLAMGYAFRSYLPLLDTVMPGVGTEALAKCGGLLPEWTEDSFSGILLNVAAGRVANRFDLGGANYTVDAACGSSLAAASQAVRELESGAADMVILGGADTVQNPFTYLAFSKTQAFSPNGRCRPFDVGADGIVISEAVAVLILKRLADAERDGDRIYALIKGMGASSDGKAKGLTAPRFEGQIRALNRAYEKAGVSPASIGYVEAHGTGTVAGDLAETRALKSVFEASGAEPGACALGSVKSLIGHTKCAAGLTGLINATLALHHRTFPPTIGVKTLNPKAGIPGSSFHISTKARPWLRSHLEHPRRAGVSAFGFGGTNFHAVLEAYEGDSAPKSAAIAEWPAELCVWREKDRETLLKRLEWLIRALSHSSGFDLRDVAHTLTSQTSQTADGTRLAIVAISIEDLVEKVKKAQALLVSDIDRFADPTGISYKSAVGQTPKLAFLFPGQGSQSPEMLGALALHFPEIVDGIEAFDLELTRKGHPAVGPRIFPPPPIDQETSERQKRDLAATEVAQPALGAVSFGLLKLLKTLGVGADAFAGHSYGELVALHSAGVFSLPGLAELSFGRGRFLRESVGDEPGTMAAILAGPKETDALIREVEGVVAANWNGPAQTVVSGNERGITRVLDAAAKQGIPTRRFPVSCAFHSPIVAAASQPLSALVSLLTEQGPQTLVYSNVTARPYSNDPNLIPAQLGLHLASPVRFAEMIDAMHADGIGVFIEVGPGSILSGLVQSILGNRPHLALACEPAGHKDLIGFLTTLGRLFVEGVPIDLSQLTERREARWLETSTDGFLPMHPVYSSTTWLVNGNRARPAFGSEPPRFGPGPALPTPVIRDEPAKLLRNGTVSLPDAPSVEHSTTDVVFDAFQKNMQTFLDVQKTTMLRYLNGREPNSMERAHLGNGAIEKAMHSEIDSPSPHLAGPEKVLTEGVELSGSAPDLQKRLLAIVSERTGYPQEMLRLDLDLEADLGIDSIKRVEILGTLCEELPATRGGIPSDLMEQLSRARTLGSIVERLGRLRDDTDHGLSSHDGKASDASVSSALRLEIKPSHAPARRMILVPDEAPLQRHIARTGLNREGFVLVTDDGRGMARRAVSTLRKAGYKSLTLIHSTTSKTIDDSGMLSVDFTSPADVERLANRIRDMGNVSGILHLLPFQNAQVTSLNTIGWENRIAVEARGFFLLLRAFGKSLADASRNGRAAVVAVTAMGGTFASLTETSDTFFPGQGAISGLVKTIAREWPEVSSRVVDVDPSESSEELVERLIEELLTSDSHSEVGYHQGKRIRLVPCVEAIGPDGIEPINIAEGAPIVITGGARGITAAITADLVTRWKPTLLILGSSPPPPERDDPRLANLTEPSSIKSKLLSILGQVGPAELERTYQSFLHNREIRDNLQSFRARGVHVEYASVDIRDGSALTRIMREWQARLGAPIGLIHGAGMIQDKLLLDKSPESYDRVFDTKFVGALNLVRAIDPENLKFAAFFASIAGRFGNRGQCDYAAANDALNKLAIWVDRRWTCRVVSMNWGPWSNIGMVSDLEGHLGRQGFGMIDPQDGSKRLGDELDSGRKGVVEVILSGDLGGLAHVGEAMSNS